MPTSPPRLRWGILGCARISRRGLIPGIRNAPSSELVAIASRDHGTAQAWAQEFQIPRALGSYQALIDDPDVQAVYIPLPNELHRPWVETAADGGKHILCEKPLALNAAEAAAMVDYCLARDVILMEAFMWRHQPRTAALRKLLFDGAIGDLRLVRSSFSFPIEPGDWRLDPARGGGALWDIGCYGVSTARLFADAEPQAIHALAHLGPTGVDLTLTAELAFPGNVIAQIDCSFEQPFRCSYELIGTSGVITVSDAYLPPARPKAALRGHDQSRELSFNGRDQYAAMVDAFATGVATRSLADPAEDGLAQMHVLDAILAAARGG
ncbi:MAG TPA: Gfo/Idh/MocA family oxidoreductase [Isosphaeraceae bacterium]|jgi:predicted dehydrogenase|nr:Gfo/Idh/MocA family oxidoreductase [Isosphaeraceae bacterium]